MTTSCTKPTVPFVSFSFPCNEFSFHSVLSSSLCVYLLLRQGSENVDSIAMFSITNCHHQKPGSRVSARAPFCRTMKGLFYLQAQEVLPSSRFPTPPLDASETNDLDSKRCHPAMVDLLPVRVSWQLGIRIMQQQEKPVVREAYNKARKLTPNIFCKTVLDVVISVFKEELMFSIWENKQVRKRAGHSCRGANLTTYILGH